MKTRILLSAVMITICIYCYGQIRVFNDNHISIGSLQKWGHGIQLADNQVSYFNPGVYTEYSWMNMTNSTNSLAKNWIVSQNNVHNFFVYGNGQIYSKGNWVCADESTMTNVAEVVNPLEKLLHLRAVQFKFRENERNDTIKFTNKEGDTIVIPPRAPYYDTTYVNMQALERLIVERDLQQIGVISSEVRRVVPEAVRMQPDGIESVDYSSLIGLLIEAVKEQQRRIEQLQAFVATDNAIMKTQNVNNRERMNVLYQNIPNPYSERSTIRYMIDPTAKQASILVFNMEGRLILHFRDLNNEGNIVINGRELSSGMYLYSLIVDGSEVDTKRMILTE